MLVILQLQNALFCEINIFVSDTPRGQYLKSSIAVRAERVCTHNSARTPSKYARNNDKDEPVSLDKFSFQYVLFVKYVVKKLRNPTKP